jgi:endonuclease G
MADLNRLLALRQDIQRKAVERWQARQADRTAAQASIAALGPGAADSLARTARNRTRSELLMQAASMRARGDLPLFIERKIGPTLDFLSNAPSEAARKAGRPVARIVSSVDPAVQPEGFATGFLVSAQLLLTNWHVFPTVADAVGCGANFLYESDEHGLRRGLTFEVDPQAFYVSDADLDYALVAIKPRAVEGSTIDQLGTITLIESPSKILIGQKINIIEYPDGGQKQYATTNNRLLDILESGFLHYETDTLEGSSGSPDFNENWELVALHHASIPAMQGNQILATDDRPWTEDMGDDRIKWVANEGVRVSAIVQSLHKQTIRDPAQAHLLASLLANTTDPVDEIAQLVSGAPATESLAVAADGTTMLSSMPRILSQSPCEAQMTQNHFSFSGPVNIHVYAAPAAAAAAPSNQPKPPEKAEEKSIRFDRNYDDRQGYQEDFLGSGSLRVPLPAVEDGRSAEMLKKDGKDLVLPYRHFSLAMNERRRLQMWSAVNVDYDPDKRATAGRASFGTDRWIPDPRIPERAQIFDSEFYAPAHQIDRGHIVRREDNAWSDDANDIEFANSDTFHWTNCTPQHQAFNRDSPGAQYGGLKGLWGDFEKYVQAELLKDKKNTKACILAGPVLAEDDPTADFGNGPIQYPVVFWKVVVVAVPGADGKSALQAYGFVLSQKDVVDKFGIEFAPGRFAKYRKPLADVTALTGVEFASALLAADGGQGA